MNGKMIAIIVVAVLIAGGAGFFAGTVYQQPQGPNYVPLGNQAGNNSPGQGPMGGGGFGRFSGQGGGRPYSGEVAEKSDTSVTIKLQDGSSKTIALTDKTTINKTAKGSIADVKQGERIVVFGTENSDGNVSANTIQVGRIGFGFGRPQNQQNSQNPQN